MVVSRLLRFVSGNIGYVVIYPCEDVVSGVDCFCLLGLTFGL